MIKLRVFLFSLVLALTQFTIFAQDEITNSEITNTKYETEKWQYIEKYFASDLNTSKLQQKVGAFLDKHSSYVAAPAACAIAFFMALYSNNIDDNIFAQLDFKILETIEYAFKITPEKDERLYAALASIIIVRLIIIFLITNKILKDIGKRLENEYRPCLQLLTNFLNNWKENKEQTPASLIPMFEKLATGDNISKVDEALAKKIVDAIITTSLMRPL